MSYLELLAQLGVGSAHPGGFHLTKELIHSLELTDKSTILDIGCGTGKTMSYLWETFGCTVEGIDAHTIMVEKANQRFLLENKPLKAISGKAENLPFSSDKYDLILCESVLFFTDLPLALTEITRVLKKGGTLLAIEMCALKLPTESFLKELNHVYGITELPTEEKWKESFLSASFRNVSVLPFGGSLTPPTEGKDTIIEEDFIPSPSIDESLFLSFYDHQHFIQKYKDTLCYNVFKVVK